MTAEEAAAEALAARRALEQVETLTSSASSIAVSPDGTVIAVVSEQGGFEIIGRTNLLDDFDTVARVEGNDRVSSLAFSPDGQQLAVTTWRDQTTVYDVGSMQPIFTIQGREPIMDVVFSADGRTILTRSLDGTLSFWDALTGQLVGSRRIE